MRCGNVRGRREAIAARLPAQAVPGSAVIRETDRAPGSLLNAGDQGMQAAAGRRAHQARFFCASTYFLSTRLMSV